MSAKKAIGNYTGKFSLTASSYHYNLANIPGASSFLKTVMRYTSLSGNTTSTKRIILTRNPQILFRIS